ncbi:5-methyltetrahydropteroyltriglutamate--homocysteine S-methyltransferase [Lactobacillus sp. S2-2]|uniref:5-methyltetrahydropteroyltriglutamate-- homocysteine S-methyltransferase n=1 Tax=Lactobacillus sp. S2-2 TaxID=2692917 RepID=UPI001F02BD51|nr:5-methyltetrahydropteroyltriglutamate--homocysteine S-methyltransferase [Lactobacillus sp. S2-2]MCF6514632.1 5-methyltetrahydropteroyltriglutamate--homocysteine S-methyltransferase [Lactobacillus sp. S2-2]
MPKVKNLDLHYDIVGSFLRPEKLKNARSDYFDNKSIDRDKLTEIENEEIKHLVEKEKSIGLKIVTDGEFRRSYWHLDTFWGFDGIKHTKQEHGYLFHGVETRNDSAQLEGKIKFNSKHPDLKAFKFLQSLVGDNEDVIARQSIPAPAQLYGELTRGKENVEALRKVYPTDEALIKDIGSAYHELILALYNAGCRDIKFDDCTWGMLADNDFLKTITDDYTNIDTLQNLYLSFNNEALKNLPEDLRISTHVCRGNYASTWAASGGYEKVAKTLFGKENVDAFYLEFDDERSGDFTPLENVKENHEVVLGLVTSKKPELENEDTLIKRIEEASQFVEKDKLSLSTQCGFASTEEGNKLTEEQQWNKIKLVIDVAKRVWG